MLLARICSILSCLDLSHVSLQLLATISQLRPVSKWSLPVATWSLRFCLMPCLPPWRARDLSLSRWEVLLLGWQAIVRNSNEFLVRRSVCAKAAEEMPQFCATVEVFQFVISDAGPEGKFVLDLKNGSGAAKAGEESGAVSTWVWQNHRRALRMQRIALRCTEHDGTTLTRSSRSY